MARNQFLVPVRFAARLFGRGVFFGLCTLALTIVILSFLTACECDQPFCGLVPIREKPNFSKPVETPKTGSSSADCPDPANVLVVPPVTNTPPVNSAKDN
jgi:hypothetical protein